jgi:hypothetical protein
VVFVAIEEFVLLVEISVVSTSIVEVVAVDTFQATSVEVIVRFVTQSTKFKVNE